jgi:para-nitrobenzyl esterase
LKKLLIFCLFCFGISNAQTPRVKTLNGKVSGILNADKSLKMFKGIPFAAPPVGDLRWKAPQPVQNWVGTKVCTEFSASPMQRTPQPFSCWSEEFIAQPEPLSEDCLYLNIWSEVKANKQPVFVWIYGGGLSSGSANCAIYDGESMAKKGVVFVSLNYRVGVFGFLAHKELSQEAPYGTSGNYGFLDQLEALKWIKKNIAAFGGDPNNVTIAGQSAGSFSVNTLIASPLAKGYFHKAIAQSGGLLSNRLGKTLAEAETQGESFMKKANQNSLASLRKLSAAELHKMSLEGLGSYGVTYDGHILPKNIFEHFKAGLTTKYRSLLAGSLEMAA